MAMGVSEVSYMRRIVVAAALLAGLAAPAAAQGAIRDAVG